MIMHSVEEITTSVPCNDNLLPIPLDELQSAAARLRPALAPPVLVRKALTEVLTEPRWSYRYERTSRGEEVVLTIAPSTSTRSRTSKPVKPYEARATSCTCKGSFVHGCKHPTACLIVAEALEPTTNILGSVPLMLVRAAFSLALATEQPLLHLVADSTVSTLRLGHPDLASAELTLDLAITCRGVLRYKRLIVAEEVERLLLALVQDAPADSQMLEIDIAHDSLSLYAWDGDDIAWFDGVVMHAPDEQAQLA